MSKDRGKKSSSREVEVGDHYPCLAWDKTYKTCRIVSVEKKKDKSGEMEYYVHFEGFDRRLDRWVDATELNLNEKLEPAVANKKEEQKLTTRNMKRKHDDINHVQQSIEDMDPETAAAELEHEERTKIKNIMRIEMGEYDMDTWYYSPYPEEYHRQKVLYICEFCLRYMRKGKTMVRHKSRCPHRHPPGKEIYRKDNVSMFEVDGKENKIYCQNLCLLAKLFLDHKTLYYDVEPFIFYIMCEVDKNGAHIVGYFSKEKYSENDYNLACILVMPPHQRKGYGKFLIAFSYELTKLEGKLGTPERPLSDLGKLTYKSYWTQAVLEVLREDPTNTSIKDISSQTGIKVEDIVWTMTSLNVCKHWRGQYVISIQPKAIDETLQQFASKKALKVFPDKLAGWQSPLPAVPASCSRRGSMY